MRDRRRGERVAAGNFPEQRDNAVAADQFFHGVDRFRRLGLRVLGDHLHLASQHSAGGVDLVHRQADTFIGGVAEGGGGAGHRAEMPDLNVAGAITASAARVPVAAWNKARHSKEQQADRSDMHVVSASASVASKCICGGCAVQ